MCLLPEMLINKYAFPGMRHALPHLSIKQKLLFWCRLSITPMYDRGTSVFMQGNQCFSKILHNLQFCVSGKPGFYPLWFLFFAIH